ncbi:MAG: hypothetical protein JO224_02635 [Pelomonas sp.]|nr:hypothetical protein [Roseateles sp.]
MLDQSYQKTEAGRAEIRQRALPLSRSARNLLLMLDASRSARGWLAMVHGSTEADLDYLIEQGLIAAPSVGRPSARVVGAQAGHAAASAVPAAVAPPAAAESAPAPEPAPGALRYDELYAYLTQNAKKQLGLIKGYKMVLDVERCGDLAALQALGRHLVAEVERLHGEAAAERVRGELQL